MLKSASANHFGVGARETQERKPPTASTLLVVDPEFADP